jgi:hypothetical protein
MPGKFDNSIYISEDIVKSILLVIKKQEKNLIKKLDKYYSK